MQLDDLKYSRVPTSDEEVVHDLGAGVTYVGDVKIIQTPWWSLKSKVKVVPHGFGTVYNFSSVIKSVEGEWCEGNIVGVVTVTFKAGGGIYVGEWRERSTGNLTYNSDVGMYDGEGIIYTTDDYVNVCANGHGTMKYADGSSYCGAWKSGAHNGRGTCTYPDGSSYEGWWMTGMYHEGTMKYADGSYYTGRWGLYNRYFHGTMHYADGSSHRGTWQLDVPHGNGILTYADGSYFKGVWKDGMRHGWGTEMDANGNKTVSKWFLDVKKVNRPTVTLEDMLTSIEEKLEALIGDVKSRRTNKV